jgi:predicted nucleic acid-binding protein
MSTAEFALDGSVILAWYFADEAGPYADAVAQRFPNARAVIPTIWPLEIANALVTGERRQRSTVAQATKWLAFLNSLPITVDGETSARALGDILSLARTHNLTAYDANYLELAMRRGLPQATLDIQLKTAATAAGVPLYSP